VTAVIAGLACEFEQIVLLAEPLVVKAVVEHGREDARDLRKTLTHVITGGEFVTEGFRRYVGESLGHDIERPELGQVVTSFGVSELGLSLAHDTPELRRVGRAIAADPALCEAVFGPVPFAPTLLQYFPDSHYLESPIIEGRASLLVTTLHPMRRIPLVRYATGDEAEVLSASVLSARLVRAGRADLVPRCRFPLLALFGRGASSALGGGRVHVERVKAALFDDCEVARLSSGRFRLEASASGRVCIESRRLAKVPASLAERFERLLSARVGFALPAVWEAPGAPGFASGFEQKTRYVD
jgi:hypothetical protein